MTELMYTKHPDLFETKAQIIDHGYDSKGTYLVLNRSIFYPQGGGQPADQGEIIANHIVYKVTNVRNIDGEVRHYIINDTLISKDAVTLQVDANRRMINSKYHTAGHLIATIVEKTNEALTAIKGHQFPGEAYVEFNGMVSNPEDFLSQTTKTVTDGINTNASVQIKELSPSDAKAISADRHYEIPQSKTLRACYIEGFSPVPCGGTHVKTLEDIGDIKILKYKSKKGKTKVFYEVL